MATENAATSEKWLIIVNPNAGVKKGTRDLPEIRELLRNSALSYELIFTGHRDHAISITLDHVAKGYRKFAVVGGDGTLNEVMNGIFTQEVTETEQITLGMIPIGTGNDWCRTFGIPFGYADSIKLLEQEKTFLQDAGSVRYFQGDQAYTRYFMNIAGMGYDALVAGKTNESKDKGRGGPLTYFYYIFAGLFQYKFVKTIIEVDDKNVFEGDLFSVNVGICQYNGGGMKQVPFAVPDDGLFDVTLIRKAPKWLVIRYANKLYDGSHVNLPFIQTFRGKTVRMRSLEKIWLEADGESLGHSPFVFESHLKKLRVVVGNEQ
jgi:diacylglycerol kinase (ATP)